MRRVGETAVLDYLTRPSPVPAMPLSGAVLPEYRYVEELPPRYTRRERGICTVDGCEKPEKEVGLCGMHYARRQRLGEVGPAHELVRGAKGEAHPKSKLTADDVRAIRASDEKGIRLAEKYGVTAALISAIRTGKQWRHVA
jgi:hypothetical protein